jgi:hypothetical protein
MKLPVYVAGPVDTKGEDTSRECGAGAKTHVEFERQEVANFHYVDNTTDTINDEE